MGETNAWEELFRPAVKRWHVHFGRLFWRTEAVVGGASWALALLGFGGVIAGLLGGEPARAWVGLALILALVFVAFFSSVADAHTTGTQSLRTELKSVTETASDRGIRNRQLGKAMRRLELELDAAKRTAETQVILARLLEQVEARQPSRGGDARVEAVLDICDTVAELLDQHLADPDMARDIDAPRRFEEFILKMLRSTLAQPHANARREEFKKAYMLAAAARPPQPTPVLMHMRAWLQRFRGDVASRQNEYQAMFKRTWKPPS